MTTKLATIPPLSQSRQSLMACPHLYVSRIVEGNQEPDNPFAVRGQDIHTAIAAYVRHLVETRQTSDYAYFEQMLKQGFVTEAVEILAELKDNFQIDPDKVLGVELCLAVDPDFKPLEFNSETPHHIHNRQCWDDPGAGHGSPFTVCGQIETKGIVEFEGTLDYVQFTDATTAEIWDWKSFWQVIEADTFQSKLYPLLLFCHYPHIQTIHFHLKFVRYSVARSVTYTRADIPHLHGLAHRDRDRQIAMHKDALEGTVFNAMPGPHCGYCPKLFHGCPIQQMNPYTNQSAEDRLRFHVWVNQVTKKNREILVHLLNVQGPLEVTDGNNEKYRAAFVVKRRTKYPLDKTLEVLDTWKTSTGEDLSDRLRVGSTDLNKYAKAKKRAPLAQQLAEIQDVTEYTEFRVTGVDEEEEEERK